MNVRKNDKVVVLSGKDKGKQGKVLEVMPKEGKVVVEKINVVSRHTKPRKAGQAGGRIKKEAPIDASNAMVICPKCGQPTRVGYRVEKQGDKAVKVRVCKKKVDGVPCGASLDK